FIRRWPRSTAIWTASCRDGRRCPPGRGEVSRSGQRGRDRGEARRRRGGAMRGRTRKDSLTVAGGRWDGGTVVAVTAGLLLSARPSVPLSAQAFPTTPPKPTPLTPVRFPPFKEATLANGLQLVVIEHHAQPVVSVTLSFRAGAIYD